MPVFRDARILGRGRERVLAHNGDRQMATKAKLVDALLDLDPNQDKAMLLKLRKADLETRLEAMEKAWAQAQDDGQPKGTMHA